MYQLELPVLRLGLESVTSAPVSGKRKGAQLAKSKEKVPQKASMLVKEWVSMWERDLVLAGMVLACSRDEGR